MSVAIATVRIINCIIVKKFVILIKFLFFIFMFIKNKIIAIPGEIQKAIIAINCNNSNTFNFFIVCRKLVIKLTNEVGIFLALPSPALPGAGSLSIISVRH